MTQNNAYVKNLNYQFPGVPNQSVAVQDESVLTNSNLKIGFNDYYDKNDDP